MGEITICVTTHDRWELFSGTLNSLLGQTETGDSIVVVDDCSRTNVPNHIEELLGKSAVGYHRHKENSGLAAARNTAIALTETEYFAFCDDDDQWPPGLSSRLVAALDLAPADVGMAIAVSEDRKAPCGQLFEDYPRLTELMKAGLTPPVGSQIYRTDLLRQVGGYRPEVSSGVDHDLWISLARIDPRVAVAWGEPAIVGSSPSRERMTTVEHRRRAKIDKSLEIWRDDLCEVFGERFYRHFVDSYRWYLDYTFFIKSIQKREYLDTLKRAIRSPWLSLSVLWHRWGRLTGRSRCTLFPEFRGD